MGNFDYPWDIPADQPETKTVTPVKGGDPTPEEFEAAFDELLFGGSR